MLKRILNGILVLTLLAASCVLYVSAAGISTREPGDYVMNEVEPNNGSSANTIYDDYTVSGTLTSGDIDYFKFTVPYEAEVTVAAVAVYTPVSIALRDSNSTLLALSTPQDIKDSDNYGAILNKSLNGGTYYFSISNSNGNYYSNTYMFYFDITLGNHVHIYNGRLTSPTCLNQGYTTYTCNCGDSYKSDYTNALGHSFTNYISNHDATKESDGTKTAKCDRCSVTNTVTDTGSKIIPIAQGTCGTRANWKLWQEGLLEITGTSAISDFSYDTTTKENDIPWFDYADQIKTVTIGNGITTIGKNAFRLCGNLQHIQIPKTVTAINSNAFWLCTALTEINIPDTVTTIGTYAFYKCNALTEIKIPGQVTVLGNSALYQCSALKTVWLPKNLTSIGDATFRGCSALKDVYFDNNCAKWAAVTIGTNNAPLQDATIHTTGHYFETYVSNNDASYDANGTETAKCVGCDATDTRVVPGSQIFINGWILFDGNWMYYNNGVKVTNGWAKDSGGWCYLDASGYMLKNTWVTHGGKVYFVNANGYRIVSQWKKDSTGWRYLGADGVMYKNAWMKDSKGWCYLGADGYMVTNGWGKDSTGWCYLGSDGYIVKNSWVNHAGKWYFVNSAGYRITKQWKSDSKGWCYLGSDGAMVTNSWIKDSKGWCYLGSDGYCVKSKWVKDSQGWCYLDSNGYIVYSKWVKDSQGWCYVGSNGYMVYNKWVKDSQGWCYVGSDGYMLTKSWVKDTTGECYVGANGYMVTNGWAEKAGNWYYMNSNGYIVKDAWVSDAGYWYYMQADGTMLANCYKVIDNNIYKFQENGKMLANCDFHGGYIGADGIIGADCFAYLVDTDTRSLQREYYYANVISGGIRVYLSEYEGLCIATRLYFRIGNYTTVYTYDVMRVLDKNIKIDDPTSYFDKLINNAFGNQKLYYMRLRNEFLTIALEIR